MKVCLLVWLLKVFYFVDKVMSIMNSVDKEKIETILVESMSEALYQMTLSKPLLDKEITKIQVRPVMIQDSICFQEARYSGNKVFHDNLSAPVMASKISGYMTNGLFGQLEAQCTDKQVHILVSKKGTVTVKIKKVPQKSTSEKIKIADHNRSKNYILNDGEPVDFLVALGVQTSDGKVVKAKYDKFRQINRYLEFVRDVLPALNGKETIRIVDFGCGKSYLTFALYYYLKIKNDYAVDIIGLDLKKDVIETCTRLAEKLGYDELKFLRGDIKDYTGREEVDMVVTLHACDTATDYAIEKAIKWNASVIMTVPCCQHELNSQIKAKNVEGMESVLKYGLIKERMAALITDAYRGNCLEQAGYDVQIMEFIDMEHTPKNILIRAVKSRKILGKAMADNNRLDKLTDYLGIHPKLGELLR